jgi:hypothetical protein
VPKGKPTLSSPATHVKLSTGTSACVFELIPGTLAKTTSPEEVGRATGELCAAMGKIKMDRRAPMAPYFNLFAAHHATTRDIFYNDVGVIWGQGSG